MNLIWPLGLTLRVILTEHAGISDLLNFQRKLMSFLFSFQAISLSFAFKRNKRSSSSAFLGPERQVSSFNSNREAYSWFLTRVRASKHCRAS